MFINQLVFHQGTKNFPRFSLVLLRNVSGEPGTVEYKVCFLFVLVIVLY